MIVAAEILVVAAIVLLTIFGFLDSAVDQSLARAAEALDGEGVADAPAVHAAAARTAWTYAGSVGLLLLARLAAFRGRRRQHVGVHLAVPAVALVTGLGLALHWGYADYAKGKFYYAPDFAQGLLLGTVLAAVVLVLPWDPALWAERGRALLAAGALAVLAALFVFGAGPEGSGARIHLFGLQPIEGVKLAFAAFLAGVLGRRAGQLRYQRLRRGWFQVPRPKLLVPAFGLMAVLFAGFLVVGDLGPTLVLALVFLGFYYVVTRSWVEVCLVALAVPLAIAYLVAARPGFVPERVVTRLDMWLDPWTNGYSNGDQLASSFWAFAAGGLTGQGWGRAEIRHLPAGHTDLVLSHLSEVAGFFGFSLYVVGIFALVAQGLWIAARNRTPERMLLAFGLTTLLFAQWLVIFGGATGYLPLTGIVFPLLSYGKTSMLTFLVLVALVMRLAVDGRPRAERDELFQLRAGITRVAAVAALVGIVALAVGLRLAVLERSETSVRGVLVMGSDEAVFLRHDPRLRAIASAIRRGEIHDRNGSVIAGTDEEGRRVYPLGEAMGTLLGPVDKGVTLPSWAVEGRMDARLRGLAPGEKGLGVWVERHDERDDRILFSVDTPEFREVDRERAAALLRPGGKWQFLRLEQRDLRPLLPVAQLRGDERREAVRRLVDDVASRTIRLTLDRELQRESARVLAEVVPRFGKAGAVAVVDVDTGHVLARAQWPDVDPGRESTWLAQVLANDEKTVGSYGPWRDKTGIGGLYQSGSVFKVFTALAWVRSGLATRGASCGSRGVTTFECAETDRQGPYYTRPSWPQAIHDSHARPDGTIELTRALEVSCNVFFAQLGLHLGPEPFEQLAADGLEVDNGRRLEPGEPGTRHLASTAFGQGAARMHVMEAVRMVATVGSGGVYRKCPPSLLLEAPCEETRVIDPPSLLEPVLAGMRRVMDTGTGRGFREIGGVRVYGKTGTATDPGRRDEEPYGLRRGGTYKEHSWFVALAESEAYSSCDPRTPGRLAVAAVVPRGGAGNGAAMRVVQGVIEAAQGLGYFRRDR